MAKLIRGADDILASVGQEPKDKENLITRREVLAATCPSCGAKSGALCTYIVVTDPRFGEPQQRIHVQRREAALKERDARTDEPAPWSPAEASNASTTDPTTASYVDLGLYPFGEY
jgi:hypothetical protein